jgi:outer membrane protein OmpA-like peptidoglycan-associated protein
MAMKKNIWVIVAIITMFVWTGNGFANIDQQAIEILEHALSEPPSPVTKDFISQALELDSGLSSQYEKIGDYYSYWLAESINPKEEWRRSAYKFYVLAYKSGNTSEQLADKLNKADTPLTEFSLRSIRPSKVGETGTGLDLRLYFELDSFRLSEKSYSELDVLAGYLLKEPGVSISLEGHTDISGDDAYNKTLSEQRAMSAKNYLLSKHGIEPNRISTTGWGSMRIINKQDGTNWINRRVELIKLSE